MKKVNKRLQAVADGYTGQNLYAGIGWHVEKAGKRIASGTSGSTDGTGKTPLGDDAIYRIYSMTKPVVSVMALMLIQRGQLRLASRAQPGQMVRAEQPPPAHCAPVTADVAAQVAEVAGAGCDR